MHSTFHERRHTRHRRRRRQLMPCGGRQEAQAWNLQCAQLIRMNCTDRHCFENHMYKENETGREGKHCLCRQSVPSGDHARRLKKPMFSSWNMGTLSGFPSLVPPAHDICVPFTRRLPNSQLLDLRACKAPGLGRLTYWAACVC